MLDTDKNLQQFLRPLGFDKNPFIKNVAEEEEFLPDYFVEINNFNNILGDPRQPKTTLFFAARGNGKTASARMVRYLLTETVVHGPVLVVSLGRDTFDAILDETNRQTELLRSGHYRRHCLKLAQAALAEQWDTLLKRDEELKLPEGLEQITDLVQWLKTLQTEKSPNVYFLIDGLDEVNETTGQPEIAARLILPFLTDLTLLETTNTAFKFFLPYEIERELRLSGQVRWDRFETFNDRSQWQISELEELLTKRLRFFSGNITRKLEPHSDVLRLDYELCRAAKGSPRNLMRLGNFLLYQHLEAGLPPMISADSFRKAINQLENQIRREQGYSSADVARPSLSIVGSDVYMGTFRLEEQPTGLELKLLKELYHHAGQTLSKNQLIEALYQGVATDQQLNATIKRLRRKLNDEAGNYIVTVWGTGYRLLHSSKSS